MARRPSVALIASVLGLAAVCMAVAIYFGGTGRTPFALAGTVAFVALGGLGFELARRRSL